MRVEVLTPDGYRTRILSEERLAAAVLLGFWIDVYWLWRDLSNDSSFGRTYRELLQRITGTYQTAPPLGKLPTNLHTEPVEPLPDAADDGKSLRGAPAVEPPMPESSSAQAALLPAPPAALRSHAAARIREDKRPTPGTPGPPNDSLRSPSPTVRQRSSRWRSLALGCASLGILAAMIEVGLLVTASKIPKGDKQDETAIVARPATAGVARPATALDAHPAPDDPAQALLVKAKSWPLAFADHFDSAEASGKTWNFPKDDEDITTSSLVSSGVLRLSLTTTGKNRKLVQARAMPAATATDDGSYLRADVKRVRGRDVAGGLVFPVSKDGTQFYCFLIKDNGYLLGVYTDKWRWARPWTRSSAIRPPAQPNSLAVLAHGANVFFFINDQKVYQSDDLWEAVGRLFGSGPAGVAVAGLAADAAVFDFANFELRLPQTAAPAMGINAMRTDTMPPSAR